MGYQGALLMVAVKNKPWNHWDMGGYFIKLPGDDDRQLGVLLFGKVEKVSDPKNYHFDIVWRTNLLNYPSRSL